MTPKHVFIHSLWRTSSTYVWHAFRRLDDVKGFYEPFHPCLKVMTPANAKGVNETDLGHSLGVPYWTEYEEVAPEEGGLPHFKRNFATRCYIPPAEGLPENQQAYIRVLLENAEHNNKVACLGFVRSCMRAGAIRHALGGTHIALIRNPFIQFTSFHHRSGFLKSVTQINSLFKSRFTRLGEWYDARCVDLDPAHHDTVAFAIYYLLSNTSALIHSHIIIDTDRLASEEPYRAETIEHIHKMAGVSPDFSDCVPAGSADSSLQEHYSILNHALADLSSELRKGKFQGLLSLWSSFPKSRNRHVALKWLEDKRTASEVLPPDA